MLPVAAMRRRFAVPAWSCRSVSATALDEPLSVNRPWIGPRSGSGRPSQSASTVVAVVPCTSSAMPSRSIMPPGVTLAIWPVACSVEFAPWSRLTRRPVTCSAARLPPSVAWAASRPRSGASDPNSRSSGATSSAWPTTCRSRPCPSIRSATVPRAVSSRPASAADSSPASRGGVPVIEPVKLWVISLSPSRASPASVHRSEAPDSWPVYEKERCGSDTSSIAPSGARSGAAAASCRLAPRTVKSGSEPDLRDVAARADRRTARRARLELDPGDVQGLGRAAQLQLTRNRAEIGQRPVEPRRQARRGGRARDLERDAVERAYRRPGARSRSHP